MRAFLARRGIEFTKKEVSQVLFTVFSFAIVFFLQKWRTTNFSKETGITYFAFLFLFFLILVFFIIAFQKRHGYSKGYRVEFENSIGYLLIAILLTFLFQAYVIVIIPGFIILNVTATRIGHFRMETHEKDVGMTSAMSTAACLIALIVFLILYGMTKSFLFKDLMKISAAVGLFTLVPTPKNNGLAVFKWSRFAFGAAAIITFLVFLAVAVTDPALLIGTIAGLLIHFAIGVFDLLPRVMYGS